MFLSIPCSANPHHPHSNAPNAGLGSLAGFTILQHLPAQCAAALGWALLPVKPVPAPNNRPAQQGVGRGGSVSPQPHSTTPARLNSAAISPAPLHPQPASRTPSGGISAYQLPLVSPRGLAAPSPPGSPLHNSTDLAARFERAATNPQGSLRPCSLIPPPHSLTANHAGDHPQPLAPGLDPNVERKTAGPGLEGQGLPTGARQALWGPRQGAAQLCYLSVWAELVECLLARMVPLADQPTNTLRLKVRVGGTEFGQGQHFVYFTTYFSAFVPLS